MHTHRRPPEMCGLRTRPRTDVDLPRFLPPSNNHRRGRGISFRRPPPPGRYLVLVSLCLLISAPPNKGDPRRMTVPAAGAEGAAPSKMITRLHSDTLYRVSVMAVTGAGSGVALFVDGRTRPAARQLHLSLYILYIFSIRFVHGSVFMFPMAGHSVLRIWTGLGVLPPYNPRMVTRELFLQRNRATPEHRGQFSNASRRGSSSSYQPRPACGRRCCGWACVQRQQLWCLRRHGTSLLAVLGCSGFSASSRLGGRAL